MATKADFMSVDRKAFKKCRMGVWMAQKKQLVLNYCSTFNGDGFQDTGITGTTF